MRDISEKAIMEEFDVAVIVANDTGSMLVCGLYNGGLQFWSINK